MREWQCLECILREQISVFFGLLAEGDNQHLFGEDGGKPKGDIQVDANNITEHYPNSCLNANPTIVIILWTLLGQFILQI